MKTQVLIILWFYASFQVLTQPLPIPYNLDFEIGEKGKLPKGWFVPSYAEKLGYQAYLSDEEPKSGRFCLELFREGDYKDGTYGSVMQSIDAKPYRGKMVKFRAYIRAEIHSPKGSAHIWLRERFGNDEESGFFEYLPNQPMVLRQWEVREIRGVIDPNADAINFGLLLFGNGKAWIDSASLEIISSSEPKTKQFEIDIKTTKDLVDFAKVYGIVRYFNPLANANFIWDCFLYNSLKYVVENRDQTISEKLKNIFNDFLQPDINSDTQFDSNGYLCWVHYGFPSEKQHPFIFSSKINILNPIRKYQGIVQQVVNVQRLAGTNFVFSAYAMGELNGYSSRIVLAIRFDDANNKQIGYLFKEFQKISKKTWTKIELNGKVPDQSVFAKPAIILVGEGDVNVDDAFFGVVNEKDENLLQNSSFESSRDSLLVFNWRLLDVSAQNGYFAFVSKQNARSGERSLHLYSDRESRVFLPSPNEKVKVTLSDNSTLEIPICVSVSTFEKYHINEEKFSESDCHYEISDKISQLAILIDIWNFLSHFGYYFDKSVNRDSLLEQLIVNTLRAERKREYFSVLETLVAFVKDDMARVIHKDISTEFGFPFLWKYIENKLFISKVEDSNSKIEVGDEVMKINNKTVKEMVDSVSKYISYSSEIWKNLKALAYIRLISDWDTIDITVKKSDGSVLTEKYSKSYLSNYLVEERPERLAFLGNEILYLDLTRIADKELKDILDTLKFSGYFVFDLRGIVLASEQFLSLFTDKVFSYNTWKLPVFTLPFMQKISWNTIKCKIEGKSLFDPKGVYFLVDERTVGIGEVIADIAKRNRIGQLVGSRTAGNPMEMVSKIFPGGVTLFFGLFKVYDGSGEEIYGKGIVPNIPVTIKNYKEGLIKDKVLEKVLFLIQQQ
ncbi:MAG: S41 family peptidase [Candidatus Kapaibacteriota bacterium]